MKYISIICCLCFSLSCYTQNSTIQLEYLTTRDGLNDNIIKKTIQGKQGFLWFATRKGISRFDGYNFRNFTIQHSKIEVLDFIQTDDQLIWCATTAGLYCFDPDKECFSKPITDLKSTQVSCLLKDEKNSLWLGTNIGLYKLQYQNKSDFENETWQLEVINKATNPRLPRSGISSLAFDTAKNIWLGTYGSYIYKYSISRRRLTKISLPKKGTIKKNRRIVVRNIQVLPDYIYIGTKFNGLIVYNRKTKQSQVLKAKLLDNQRTEFADILVENDKLWLATWNGIDRYVHKENRLIHQNTFSELDLFQNKFQNQILHLFRDKSGVLWGSTAGKGVLKITMKELPYKEVVFKQPFATRNFINTKDGKLAFFSSGKSIKQQVDDSFQKFKNTIINLEGHNKGNYVYCVAKDHQGDIWAGGRGNLIYILKHDGGFKEFFVPFPKKDKKQTRIRSLFFDSKQNLWIGTNKGVVVRSSKNQQFYFNFYDSQKANTISHNLVLDIIEDTKGNIWLGTERGLNKVVFDEGNFSVQVFDKKEKNHTNSVRNLKLIDGKIVMTYGGRIAIFKESTIEFISDTYVDTKKINTLLIGPNKHLWIGTNSGIIKYDIDSRKYKEFCLGMHVFGSYLHSNGQLFFSNQNGFIIMDSNDYQLNTYAPQPQISNLKIRNQNVYVFDTIHNEVVLTEALSDTKSIQLSGANRNFSLEYASLSFLEPKKNKYAYFLEGYDDDWNHVNANQRTISYHNLTPGSYIFHVKAANNDGVWSVSKRLAIDILPFWYETFWFKFLLITSICSLLFALYKWRVYHLEKARKLELKIQKSKDKVAKEKEISEIKTTFFTNLSHEIRTPLTLIISPLTEMINSQDLSQDYYKKLSSIYQSAERLLVIVNQLLDFKKIEKRGLELSLSYGNISEFIRKMIFIFKNEAEQKNIQVTITNSDQDVWINFDIKHLETVFINLLSNAFKFTPSGGEINISIIKHQNDCKISISDTGIGIAKQHLEKLFDRFYQVPDQTQKGSGIGLSLVKEVVLLHGGTIEVYSELNKGTTFEICFPIKEEEETRVDAENDRENKFSLLIVEDTIALQEYLYSIFKDTYTVTIANHGKEALKLLDKNQPDLIISDVMMPEMDGIEFCQAVKSNDATSYIPFILLTAKTGDVHRMEGLENGADDYMTKPFHTGVLKLKAKNLINTRIATQKYFKQQVHSDFGEKKATIQVKSEEQQFINKAIEIVEQNLTNADFNSEVFAGEFNMSRATLYRRIKMYTDLSINHFIRSVKIKKAGELLQTKEYTITEICYKVGYQNVNQFRAYFVEHFGVTPSKYPSKGEAF